MNPLQFPFHLPSKRRSQKMRFRGPEGTSLALLVGSVMLQLGCFLSRLFGGLKKDLKHKFQYYASDFRDGLALQSIASIIFLYFATLTPIVAFGAVLGGYTQNQMVRHIRSFLLQNHWNDLTSAGCNGKYIIWSSCWDNMGLVCWTTVNYHGEHRASFGLRRNRHYDLRVCR